MTTSEMIKKVNSALEHHIMYVGIYKKANNQEMIQHHEEAIEMLGCFLSLLTQKE